MKDKKYNIIIIILVLLIVLVGTFLITYKFIILKKVPNTPKSKSYKCTKTVLYDESEEVKNIHFSFKVLEEQDSYIIYTNEQDEIDYYYNTFTAKFAGEQQYKSIKTMEFGEDVQEKIFSDDNKELTVKYQNKEILDENNNKINLPYDTYKTKMEQNGYQCSQN